jgi:hypothetical protein
MDWGIRSVSYIRDNWTEDLLLKIEHLDRSEGLPMLAVQ